MPGYEGQKTAVCGGCAHFRQHYVKCGWRYQPLEYGHCVYPLCKRRRVGETCPHWTARKVEV